MTKPIPVSRIVATDPDEFLLDLMVPNRDAPCGYCDGTGHQSRGISTAITSLFGGPVPRADFPRRLQGLRVSTIERAAARAGRTPQDMFDGVQKLRELVSGSDRQEE